MSKRRSLIRISGFRDASILGIACEGDKTEYRYFTEFINEYSKYPARIHVELIKKEKPNESAPELVIVCIDNFKRKIGVHPIKKAHHFPMMRFVIGQARLELATPSPPDLYANHLRYCPIALRRRK